MVLPVGTSNTPRRVEKSEKKPATSPDGRVSFAALVTGEAAETESAAPAGTVLGAEAAESLFTVQAVDERTERRARHRKAVQKAEELLEKLEHLQASLLTGAVPKETIMSLAQAVRQRKDATLDPRLLAVLDDIDLRIEVELAKLSRG